MPSLNERMSKFTELKSDLKTEFLKSEFSEYLSFGEWIDGMTNYRIMFDLYNVYMKHQAKIALMKKFDDDVINSIIAFYG